MALVHSIRVCAVLFLIIVTPNIQNLSVKDVNFVLKNYFKKCLV